MKKQKEKKNENITSNELPDMVICKWGKKSMIMCLDEYKSLINSEPQGNNKYVKAKEIKREIDSIMANWGEGGKPISPEFDETSL